MSWRIGSLIGGSVWVAGAGVFAAPQAGLVSSSWQLDFEFHDPQRITLHLPGEKEETTYWYMVYQVTNNTGRDVQFYPSFELVTDTLAAVEGGAEISPRVYDAVAARHRIEYPFITVPTKITGLLLQGEANARASIAVFRTFDPDADGFTIFLSGLSGEIERVSNPSFDPPRGESDANPRFFLLRRTLAIRYDLPGEAGTRPLATPIRRNREWVMR
jgi:hypothetical protein